MQTSLTIYSVVEQGIAVVVNEALLWFLESIDYIDAIRIKALLRHSRSTPE